MKLKKKLNLLQEYVDKTPQLEDSEIIPINEETESYQKGQAAGKAFQAAVVLAVVVFIAIRRAKMRLRKKWQREVCYRQFGSNYLFAQRRENALSRRGFLRRHKQFRKP